jgi:cell division protein FtsB
MLPAFYMSQQQKRASHGRISLHILIFSIILFLGFVFLYQTNNLVVQSYSLRKSQATLQSFRDENQKLKGEIVELESLAALQEATKDFGMVVVDQVGYADMSHVDATQPFAKLP